MKSRAAVAFEAGKPLQIVEIDVAPPKAGKTIVLQQIADAIRVKNGHHHPTREAVRLRFGPYLAHRT